MKNFIFLTLFLISNTTYAWTLISSSRAGYASSNITVYTASNTCTNAGLSPTALQTLVKDALNDYWNKVPTSALTLTDGGIAAASMSATTSMGTATALTTPNTIIVGCSANVSEFSSHGILAVGGMSCTGTNCTGAVIVNDASGTYIASSTQAVIKTALAHELGHALGLGHSSIQESLMYYSLSSKVQDFLHQDDMDGITYLYPNQKKLGGLGGSCSAVLPSTNSLIKSDKNSNETSTASFIFSLILGFSLIGLGKIIFNNNARTY